MTVAQRYPYTAVELAAQRIADVWNVLKEPFENARSQAEIDRMFAHYAYGLLDNICVGYSSDALLAVIRAEMSQVLPPERIDTALHACLGNGDPIFGQRLISLERLGLRDGERLAASCALAVSPSDEYGTETLAK